MFNEGQKKMVDLKISISFAQEILPFASLSRGLHDTDLSPWKITQCYLESLYQVALIHEMVGDATESKNQLLIGRNISDSYQLPLFVVAFSSLLGKLYCKQRHCDLAEEELVYVEKHLKDNNTFCCSKCKLIFEVTLAEYFEDLNEIKSDNSKGGASKETGKKRYKESFDKLDHSKWEESLGCPEDFEKQNKGFKRVRKTESGALSGIHCNICSKCTMTDVFSKLNCWHCLTHEVSKSNLLCKFLDLKWEFIRRKLALNLLSRSAKCFANPDQIEEAHENILRRISLLVGRNLSCTLSSITLDLFCHLVAKEIPGDIFAIERANIVYDVCRFSLELYHSETTRTIFDNPSSIKFGDLANYLMIAFVLSREVPMVLREVSLLLAVMYTISDTCTEYSQLLPFSETLKENRCSLYFHQASIGTHFTWKLLSQLNGRFEDPAFSRSSCIKGTFKSLRLPETLDGIEEHVNKFLADLPSRTTVGISMLGHGYNSLLQKFLADFTRVEATILVSRRNSKKETCVKLLPVTSILQAEGDLRSTSETYAMYAKPTCDWRCSWDFTVIDDVAPVFRTILEEDYLSVQPLQNSERLYQMIHGGSGDGPLINMFKHS